GRGVWPAKTQVQVETRGQATPMAGDDVIGSSRSTVRMCTACRDAGPADTHGRRLRRSGRAAWPARYVWPAMTPRSRASRMTARDARPAELHRWPRGMAADRHDCRDGRPAGGAAMATPRERGQRWADRAATSVVFAAPLPRVPLTTR